MRQFISAALVMAFDDKLGRQNPLTILVCAFGQQFGIGPDVGQDHILRAGKLQQYLAGFICLRDGVKSAVGLIPRIAAVIKLDVVPLLAAIIINAPVRTVFVHLIFDKLINLAGGDKDHVFQIQLIKVEFIKEPGVETNNDQDIGIVFSPDQGHQIQHHLQGGVVGVAMLFATAQDGVDNQPVPDQMQGLEAFEFFVGGRDALSLFGLVIIHGHAVAGHLNDRWFFTLESPDEQPLEHTTEDEGAADCKRLEETFSLICGGHLIPVGGHGGGIAIIILEFIKATHVEAAAVKEEAKNLLE